MNISRILGEWIDKNESLIDQGQPSYIDGQKMMENVKRTSGFLSAMALPFADLQRGHSDPHHDVFHGVELTLPDFFQSMAGVEFTLPEFFL
jgi:hypothetical protein